MTETQVLKAPSGVFVPQDELVQQWIPVGQAESEYYYNTIVPRQLHDNSGNQAELRVTPSYNCYWSIFHSSLWRSPDAIWSQMYVSLSLTPMDDNSRTTLSDTRVNVHAALSGRANITMTGLAKLKRGHSYVCKVMAQSSSGYYQAYWMGDPSLILHGYTFGHGTF